MSIFHPPPLGDRTDDSDRHSDQKHERGRVEALECWGFSLSMEGLCAASDVPPRFSMDDAGYCAFIDPIGARNGALRTGVSPDCPYVIFG